jgi:site-specific recombinase
MMGGMTKLTPDRRRIVLVAASGGIIAALPTLLFSTLTGPLHHVVAGFCIGLSIACSFVAVFLMARDKRSREC